MLFRSSWCNYAPLCFWLTLITVIFRHPTILSGTCHRHLISNPPIPACDTFVVIHFQASKNPGRQIRPGSFQMQCGHAVSAGFIFLCHSEVWWGSFPVLLRPQASPPKSKSGSYCTIAFYQAVSCLLCTIAETVGLSPAATPGAPFIPMGKDAMTPWIFFSSRPPFYHKTHYVTRFLR